MRHTAILERLDDIARHVRFDWHLFLLGLGAALWRGLAPGPAILVAVAIEFFGAIALAVVFNLYHARRVRR